MGLVGFAIVVTVGALLATGSRPAKGVLVGLALGSLAGATFVHWLAFQSLYRIGALCPWCLVVWSVTIPIAVWSVLIGLAHGPPLTVGRPALVGPLPARHRLVPRRRVLALVRFWSYWRTLL